MNFLSQSELPVKRRLRLWLAKLHLLACHWHSRRAYRLSSPDWDDPYTEYQPQILDRALAHLDIEDPVDWSEEHGHD